MNFDLNEDEEMLKALTERFVSDHYDHESRRAFLAEPNGFSAANWELLGELGLIAAPFPESVGGLGLDATGIATVFEALGHGMVVEPLAESVVLAGCLFAKHAPDALREVWIEALLTGEKRLAIAHAETRTRDNPAYIGTIARKRGDGFALSGEKPYCIRGAGADAFIVSARLSGVPGDRDGIALFLVPADTDGLTLQTWRLADGTRAVALTLDDVHVPSANKLDAGLADLQASEVPASLARSAEALGIMERMFADTLDYLRTRRQFGTPLGSFQAIQHRMVAQYAELEQCRALLNLALVKWGSEEFAKAVHGMRAYIADVSLDFAHEMIQFHGGMGVTNELAVSAGHKRLFVLSRWPESSRATLDRYAGLVD